ncbi:DNA cytosine-5-methyltransferase, partial [Nymphaea thermarum]
SGENASIWELADSIYASQTDKATADYHPTYGSSSTCEQWGEEERSCDSMDGGLSRSWGKRKGFDNSIRNKDSTIHRSASYMKRQRVCYARKSFNDDEETVPSNFWVPAKTMVGFGLPNNPITMSRKLPDAAIGPPYFYYENVALTPKGVWETISRFLYDIKPEFVDSKHFSAAARKRGYIHNLPIDNRFQLQPIPLLTIQEALPYTKKWWPSWDPRQKLNCIQTCTASAKLTERLRNILAASDGPPSYFDQQKVLEQCRKWNLVWVGRHKLAPLEPDEIEPLLGFPKYHTRGGGVSRTERLKALGNSFQVDTVAYHLSVLKIMFPNGLNVLSLFSGIGGAEVALHRLGIRLKNVVSIEKSEISRNILKNWWYETDQKGKLVEIADVEQLTNDKLATMMRTLGGFDLIIGGSPCNNLTGSNRVSRHGLEGTHSALFFDYFRILDAVFCIMSKQK